MFTTAITRSSLPAAGAAVLVLAFCETGIASAQDPVHWKATVAGKKPTPGLRTAVKLTATIDAGWHIYSLTQEPGGPSPTKFTVMANQPFTLSGTIKGDPPDVRPDRTLGINLETYENGAEFTLPIVVSTMAKPGPQTMQVAVYYQACSASLCLPPKTKKISVTLYLQKAKSRRI